MASTSQLKRMSTRSQPRTTRYRYVVNDLPPPPPPVLPPPDSELPPIPPANRPTRTARSASRPTPTPSRAASPVPVTLPLNVPRAEPKQTRRRSRSLGSLPPPPPYDAVEDSPPSSRGRAGAAVPADPAVVLDLKDKSLRTLRRMSRSLTQLRSRARSNERGPEPSTAQKPLVTVIPPVPIRAQSTERGPPPSHAYKPLVTVIPPMPDRAPPLPSDEPTSSTTPIARPVASSKAEASLGRAPPMVRTKGAPAAQDQMANPRPAPKPPTSNKDPPMPLAARDDSAVREQVQGIKLRRISRSYTNLRLMATPDSLQAEQQTNRALQLQASKDAALERTQSRSPRPLPTLPQQSKEQVNASSSNQAGKIVPATQPIRRVLPAPPSTPPSGPLPAPPPPQPAVASVGEQPTPASRKGRGILATSAARLKAMSPMSMMSSFAPARPSSRDSTSSRTTASSHSHSHSYSSHATASVSSHTTASSSSHSHSHSYSHSPSSRAPPLAPFANVNRSRSGSAASASRLVIPIPRSRPARALPPPEVYTPVDPVVAPNNRISFLKPAMVKPYMGQRF